MRGDLQTAIATLTALASTLLVGAESGADPSLVTLDQGQVRGSQEVSRGGRPFFAFRSLPFASPPVGDLRMEPPVAAPAWEGVREVLPEPPVCPQPNMAFFFGGPPGMIGSEDCLYLNVFKPTPEPVEADQAQPKLLPVFVYIHGGGFMCGSAADAQPFLMMDKDVVLVAIQYRIGTLGFLSTEDDVAPGNMGMLDQTMALLWVQQNIAEFGGNPLQVTIAGTSAGSASAHLQVLSHTSLGYFQRAVMMSGTALDSWAVVKDHRFHAYEIAKALDCKTTLEKVEKLETPEACGALEMDSVEHKSCVVEHLSSEKVLQCMKASSVEDMTDAQFMFRKFHFLPVIMGPRVHKNFLMKDPAVLLKEGRHKKVDLVFGYTKHDGVVTLMPIFSNEALRSAIKFNFENVAHHSIMMDPNEISAVNQTIKLFDHYVGNINFGLEDTENLVKLYTDADFWHSTDMAASIHASTATKAQKGKVFMYEWAFRGSLSFNDFFNARDIATEWVAHADDMFFLFGAKDSKFPENDKEKAMSEVFLEMLTSFAYTGTPTLENVNWATYESSAPNVMVFDSVLPCTQQIKSEERKLWRSLPLKRNLVLFPDSVQNLTVSAAEVPSTGQKTEL